MPHTFTNRQGLVQIDGNEELPDTVGPLNDTFEKLDDAIDRIVTSGSRPSAPYGGMRIFETDTKALAVRDGVLNRWLHQDNEWQPFTPEIRHGGEAGANITIGGGSLVGRYLRQGRNCHVRIALSIGAGTNYNSTGVLHIGYPFPRDNDAAFTVPEIEGIWRGAAGTTVYHGQVYHVGTLKFAHLVITMITNSTAGLDGLVSNTTFPSPGHYWVADFTYQMA